MNVDCEKFRFRRVLVDKGGVGEAVVEGVMAQGLRNVKGVEFTAGSKAEMLSYLKGEDRAKTVQDVLRP